MARVFHFFLCIGLGRCPERPRHKEAERGEGDVLRRKDREETETGRWSPPKLPFSFITIPSKNCEWLVWSSHSSLGFETTLHPPFCPSKPRPCPRTPSAIPPFLQWTTLPCGNDAGEETPPLPFPLADPLGFHWEQSSPLWSGLLVWQADRSRANKQNEY